MAHLQPLINSAIRESNGKISPVLAAFITRMVSTFIQCLYSFINTKLDIYVN